MNDGLRDDTPTLLALGAIVSITASLAHELLGHGTGCAIDGGRITLLTFLVFRCAGAGVLADGGGPVGAFAVGCAALLVLRTARPRSALLALFLFALGVPTLLWVWAQMIKEGLDGSDDWGHVAADVGWAAGWHATAIVIGAIGYAATLRIARGMSGPVADGRPLRLLIPYLAATVSAVVLGALWHGDRAASALDGLLSFGVAPAGYLLLVRQVARESATSGGDSPAALPDSAATPGSPAAWDLPLRGPIKRDVPWLVSAAVLWLAFALTIARGVGPLA